MGAKVAPSGDGPAPAIKRARVEPYPEHAKLKELSDRSQIIGSFLDWLQNERKITLCEIGDNSAPGAAYRDDPRYVPAGSTIEVFLAEYFGIDLDKIEEEKRQMLAGMKAHHERTTNNG